MIDKEEIDRKSEELGAHVSNVQRDYVFGWLLSGLFQRFKRDKLDTKLNEHKDQYGNRCYGRVGFMV